MPIKTQAGDGRYAIDILRRPAYCGYNSDLDGQDGFPRYFFGSADKAKAQMETWVDRRVAYRAALK